MPPEPVTRRMWLKQCVFREDAFLARARPVGSSGAKRKGGVPAHRWFVRSYKQGRKEYQMVVMVSAIPRVAWSARRTFSTGPPLIQREGPLDVRVGVARRLSHRYRDIYNTLTQGLASTCAVPPMHSSEVTGRGPGRDLVCWLGGGAKKPGARPGLTPWRPAVQQTAASRSPCELPGPPEPAPARKIRTRSAPDPPQASQPSDRSTAVPRAAIDQISAAQIHT